MVDRCGDDSQSSDHDELVDNSDYDDDYTDFDDVQLNQCKHTVHDQNDYAGNIDSYSDDRSQQSLLDVTTFDEVTPKLYLFAAAMALFITAFALLITFPLYLEQLSIEMNRNNAYGALLFLSMVATIILLAITSITSIVQNWNISIWRMPFHWKR